MGYSGYFFIIASIVLGLTCGKLVWNFEYKAFVFIALSLAFVDRVILSLNILPDLATDALKLNVKIGSKTIKFDESQAKKYIKLGVKAEKYESVLSVLEELSKREKLSVDEFVNSIKTERDNSLKEKLLAKVNGDEELAQKLMDLETKKADEKDDFSLVLEHFKEYKSYDDIPSEAIIISETKSISLFDAVLRYLFFQSKLIEKEQKNRQKNKQRAVGSLKTNEVDYGLSYISAMLKAINN